MFTTTPERAERGALYIATGEYYLRHAMRSIASLKRHHPELHATLVTDGDGGESSFDQVLRLRNPTRSKLDNIATYLESPYDTTLLLDADTWICTRLDSLFELSGKFELLATLDSYFEAREGVPDSFWEINAGVMVYRKTDAIKTLFEAAQQLHRRDIEKDPRAREQPAIREALYRQPVRHAAIPVNYNFCVFFPQRVVGKVAVIHAHDFHLERHPGLTSLEDLERELNRFTGERLVFPHFGIIPTRAQGYDFRILWMLQRRILAQLGRYVVRRAKKRRDASRKGASS